MTGRLHRLHRDRDQARGRVDWCRTELARFESYADPAKEHDSVMLCRAAYAALQLEDALKAEGLAL